MEIKLNSQDELFDVTQPRISDLKRGEIQLFTIDALVNILGKLDIAVVIIIDNCIAA
jgi:predicted XRE-type DNA-binding protein